MNCLASQIKSYQAQAYAQTHGPTLPFPRFLELRRRGSKQFIKIQREGATQWIEDAEAYFRSPALLISICGVYSLGLHALGTPLRNLRKEKNDHLQLRVQVLETTLRLQKAEIRARRAKIRYYRQEIKRIEEEQKMVEEKVKRERKRRW